MTDAKLSPNKKAIINKDNYAAYVANLEATGTKFPINQFGDANISLVAEKCGFKRGVLQNKDSFLGKVFQADLKRIGTEILSPEDKDSKLEVKAMLAAKNASKLEKELERVTAEVELLRDKLVVAHNEIQILKQCKLEDGERLEYMLESGRRVFL